jgi:hypothetical protein
MHSRGDTEPDQNALWSWEQLLSRGTPRLLRWTKTIDATFHPFSPALSPSSRIKMCLRANDDVQEVLRLLDASLALDCIDLVSRANQIPSRVPGP